MTVESARSPETRSYQQVSLCDVGLVEIRLNALITSVRAEMTARAGR